MQFEPRPEACAATTALIMAREPPAVARLELFLARELVECLLELLVVDVDDGELLSVVGSRGILDGLVYEVHGFGRYGLALVAAHAGAAEQ